MAKRTPHNERSLVAHFVRDEGVAGSNPVIPTTFSRALVTGSLFCIIMAEEP